jgi:hypothetical protein
MIYLLAQASVDPWRFPPTSVLGWIGFVAVFLAALAGIIKAGRYLVTTALAANQWGFRRWKENRRVQDVMSDITSEEGWPNGSRSLKESHQTLYDKVVGIEGSMKELTRTVENVLIPLTRDK